MEKLWPIKIQVNSYIILFLKYFYLITYFTNKCRFQIIRSTENLLHRLFVCIAGVADQLQTNFASDLRQILRSVFLMNISPSIEEIEMNIDEKSKDSTSLFEFRASENDVIQENDGGSNQSIYSAEEANPENDSVFEQLTIQPSQHTTNVDQQEQSSSLGIDARSTFSLFDRERVQSLNNGVNGHQTCLTVSTTNQTQHRQTVCVQNDSIDALNQTMAHDNNNNYNNSGINNINNNDDEGNNINTNPQTSSLTTTTSITYNQNNTDRGSSNCESPRQLQQQRNTCPVTYLISNQSQPQQSITETPPRWIPDEEASQCMSCSQTFTTFRRRHHCRCCGGVFCGICSNSQAPLPKYGLNKAVRVCRNCFTLQIPNASGNGTQI